MLDERDLDQIGRVVSLLLENQINPQLRLLAEGQQAILDKLVPVSRVDELETEVKFLRAFVVQLAEKVELLQKAQ